MWKKHKQYRAVSAPSASVRKFGSSENWGPGRRPLGKAALGVETRQQRTVTADAEQALG